ncbi:MAG: glycosyltransferase [Verrucomicrobia bacterium]|nr:glycosyltransferase [Verrucomicrobiota bacterium]MBU1734924.1 glycosyltransferase [Verrucomicrobiota bacterium]MBU1857718.1 glycosyltransferase [Verrucomicrobiota bacterium]
MSHVGAEKRPKVLPVGACYDPAGCLFEVAWEVCQQLGGIYTVLRSKIPSMIERWGERYCLIGPYNPATAAIEFDEAEPPELLRPALQVLHKMGYQAHFGHWLVTGRPQVILLDFHSAMPRLIEFKYFFWEHHQISTPKDDHEINEVLAFGLMVCEFFRVLTRQPPPRPAPVIAHFHEWMGGAAIPEMRRENLPVGIVFTTHATLLGRYLAMSDPWFYDHLPFINWNNDARRFNIETRVQIERAAAHGAHVFTTVSNVTAMECKYLLSREVDLVLPNGLNIERFIARHESENLHKVYKEKIHQFVTGHFFPSYSFNLDRTLYAFTSGRYEYRNKGFDLTLEALARLNYMLKQAGQDITVVMFLITRKPFRSMLADVLNNKAMTEELHQTCMAIKDQLGERLFEAAARGQMPDLNTLMDDYWRLRLRRTMQSLRTARLPMIVTHDLLDQEHDEVLNQLRRSNLVNKPDDPVKIVYHPDFITTTNPLFSLDYDQFVRGCHLGLFPSYYEPWGYTPVECLARGIPAVASDLSGFGNYILSHTPDCEKKGLFVVKRKNTADTNAADELSGFLFKFARLELRDRITLRFRAQELAEQFDWKKLIHYYNEAHAAAAQQMSP